MRLTSRRSMRRCRAPSRKGLSSGVGQADTRSNAELRRRFGIGSNVALSGTSQNCGLRSIQRVLHPLRPNDLAVMVVAGGVDEPVALAFVETIESQGVLVGLQCRWGNKLLAVTN